MEILKDLRIKNRSGNFSITPETHYASLRI